MSGKIVKVVSWVGGTAQTRNEGETPSTQYALSLSSVFLPPLIPPSLPPPPSHPPPSLTLFPLCLSFPVTLSVSSHF